jgi:hypothetical protein
MSVFNLIASEDRARARSDWTGPLREAALRDFDEPSAAEIARASHCAQYTMVRRDGSRFLAEVNTAAVHNAAGQPLVFSSVARNIDRRQEMERPRRRAGPRWLRPLPVELRER